jgi:hypothetical protein
MRRLGVIAALGAVTESWAARAEFPHRATRSLLTCCRNRSALHPLQGAPGRILVSSKGGKTVRPWCLSCCDGLDQSRRDVVPLGSLFVAQIPNR